MNVDIINNTRRKIDQKFVSEVIVKFCRAYKIGNKELSVVFIGDILMRRLNKQWRQIDRVTDILSFSGEQDSLGELIVDYAQIRRQSTKYSLSVKNELAYILIHGLLHLIGYDDEREEDALEMAKIGQKLMKRFFSVKINLQS